MKETVLLGDLKDWRFTLDLEGIAWAVFDREGESANSLGRRPLEELMRIVGSSGSAPWWRICST